MDKTGQKSLGSAVRKLGEKHLLDSELRGRAFG